MSPLALAYVRDTVLATIGIACGALTIAILFGVPLALVLARGGKTARILAGALALVRAIPELVLAIIAVVALGLGPIAGVVALGVHYTAVVAKLYAEILGSVRRDGAEALQATGAGTTTAFLVGIVPYAWPGLVSFGAYAFESIIRASVIVGVVGAGGVGSVLVQDLAVGDYRGFAFFVAVLAALVIVVDVFTEKLRTRAPAWLTLSAFGAIVIAGIAAFALTDTPPWRALRNSPRHLASFFAGAFPPDLGADTLAIAAHGLVDSVLVAVTGTLGGALLALPFAALITIPVARGWIRGTGWRPWSLPAEIIGRGVIAIGRAIPPIALGMIAIVFVGLGPRAGALALVVHTACVLAKLIAESLELGDREAAEALVAGGATASAAFAIGFLPAALPIVAAHTLYRFEWNVRASTILGMVGAGGLGQAIFNEQQLLHYHPLLTYVLVAIALVLAIDVASARARRSLPLETMTLN